MEPFVEYGVDIPDRSEIIDFLTISGPVSLEDLCKRARSVRGIAVGDAVHLRGFIEWSNCCAKNCLYCGLRSDNEQVNRYILSPVEVMACVREAKTLGMNNIVIQGGECQHQSFTLQVTALIRQIRRTFGPDLRITLSLGEQSSHVYEEWFDAGADRYLLRIEAGSPGRYERLHPMDENHKFENRIDCLDSLRNIGYQTGSGVLIGVPFQKVEDLADDLTSLASLDVDMVGMGPYLEHASTPMYELREFLLPPQQRLELSLRMIATLRLLMPSINIASTTALDVLSPQGRMLGLMAGANVLMPNLTPPARKRDYSIYEGKPGLNLDPSISLQRLTEQIETAGMYVAYGQNGDSLHYKRRTKSIVETPNS